MHKGEATESTVDLTFGSVSTMLDLLQIDIYP